jgi:predicted GIY-YIG superfamily endonuclease
MYAQLDSIIRWRGSIALRCPPPAEYYVYLLHFHSRYYHAGHYCGATARLDARLLLHKMGRGAKLMKAIVEAGITFELARLWKVETWEEARELERKLKARHDGPSLCPICQHKPLDTLVQMRRGHWPFSLFAVMRPRQPMTMHSPRFVRRERE